MIRLAVVDDHPAILAAIAAAARTRPGLEVVGQATDVDAAIELLERTRPDVVVCDVWIGGQPGC